MGIRHKQKFDNLQKEHCVARNLLEEMQIKLDSKVDQDYEWKKAGLKIQYDILADKSAVRFGR